MSSRFDTPACPATLTPGFKTYSPPARRQLFDGKKVFHVTNGSIDQPEWIKAASKTDDETGLLKFRMSLPGRKLIPDNGGAYMLSTPDPFRTHFARFPLEIPGNRHLCMQLAARVFDIDTAPNAMYFFENGHPAHLVKLNKAWRGFDAFTGYFPCKNFSYLDLMNFIDQLVAANIIAKEKFFTIILFLWLIGDYTKDLSRFTLTKTNRGDFITAPLTNAVSIRLHGVGPEIGVPGGLYPNDRNTPVFHENGHYTSNEFFSFGRISGISEKRLEQIFKKARASKDMIPVFARLSFLPREVQEIFIENFYERWSRV